eukprot:810454-Rhodomonas_salina.1
MYRERWWAATEGRDDGLWFVAGVVSKLVNMSPAKHATVFRKRSRGSGRLTDFCVPAPNPIQVQSPVVEKSMAT